MRLRRRNNPARTILRLPEVRILGEYVPGRLRHFKPVPSAMPQLTLELIDEAREFLRPRIRRTPVEASPGLSAKLGVPTWLKLESLQITGSFKIRGAFFRLSRASEAERRSGIVTCSAGQPWQGRSLCRARIRIAAPRFSCRREWTRRNIAAWCRTGRMSSCRRFAGLR